MRVFAKAALLACLLAASQAQAANYGTCLIDNLKGVKNAQATNAALKMCKQKYPDQYYEVQRGSERSTFGYSTPEQCVLGSARDITSTQAANLVRQACDCLYTPPRDKYDMCQRFQLPADLASLYDLRTPQMQLKVETHYRKLFAIHPNAYDIMSSEVFWPWVQASQDRARTLLQGDVEQVSTLFDQYKQERVKAGLLFTSNESARGPGNFDPSRAVPVESFKR
ncbi:hypothetical protein ACFIQF_12980 [Comamonas sp. J-3]|uniref:hypothetical protein n=1 Tax=Comamonas trifloxystrobinivorans TaxID=3350256 RepID=UPI00372AB567